MKRLAFCLGVLAVLFSSMPTSAQSPLRVARVGLLDFGTEANAEPRGNWPAFHRQLRELGYIEGENVILERRWANGQESRLPQLAADLVARKVHLIVASSSRTAVAAKQASSSIPIVMILTSDPIGTGLVNNLARPEANVTGLTTQSAELSAKRLQLLKEIIPSLRRVALLADTTNTGIALFEQETVEAARTLGLSMRSYRASTVASIDAAFDVLIRDGPEALVVTPGPSFGEERLIRIMQRAADHRLPTVGVDRGFAADGGIIAYGPHYPDLFRRAAIYVVRILKGARPSDLPVEQPSKFNLVINVKTARTLGISFPSTIIYLADEVIE